MAVAAVLVLSGPASALDSFVFDTPGAPDDLRSALFGASVLDSLIGDGGVTDPAELVAAARAEYSRLLGALYNNGYYAGSIRVLVDGREAASIPPLERPRDVRAIRVVVEPGPRYTFSRAGAAPLAPGTDLPPGYAAGAPAETRAIRDAASTAVDAWRSVGHAKASVAGQRIVANHPTQQVSSDLTLAPGPRLTFGNLTIRGAEQVRTDRIRAISGYPQGRVFDPEELRKTANRLRRTGAFRSVALVEAETPNPDGTLDIELRLAEEKPRRFGGGVEWSTVEGLSASAFWLHRNFFGGAERFRIEGTVDGIDGGTGGTDWSLGASFSRPASIGPDSILNIQTKYEFLDEPDFEADTFELTVFRTRIASDILEYGIGGGVELASVRDADGTQEYSFITLPMYGVYDTRDDELDATSGIYGRLDLKPFAGLRGSADGARATFDGRTYLSLGTERAITLAGRVQLGTILEAPIDGVPNDDRFYSGGGGTVRGQEYQSLGIDFRGQSSGGRSFLGLSAEARVGITDAISGVGFVDFGMVGRDSIPDSSSDSHAGIGVGVRYDTGIGPIRADIALPVEDDISFDDVHLYIGIGQAF